MMNFNFGDSPEPLEVKVALSAVSTAGALANLRAEASPYTFDEIREKAATKWRNALSSVEVEGDDDARTMFYTSLYHTMINPSVYMDVDGRYRGLDLDVHQLEEGESNYTVFSLWDTYRAEHLSLIHI